MKLTLPTGKEESFVRAMPTENRRRQCDTEACSHKNISWDGSWAVLHFAKNDKSLFRCNLLTAGQRQVLQDTVNIFGGLEELLVFQQLFKINCSMAPFL